MNTASKPEHKVTPGAVRLVAEKLREEINYYIEDSEPNAVTYAARLATLGELLVTMILDCEAERGEGDITS